MMHYDTEKYSKFRHELEQLINQHSMENGSDTPDFMLAQYLTDCLVNFDNVMRARERWYNPPGANGGDGTTPVAPPK